MKDYLVKTKNNYQYVDYHKQIIPIRNDMRTTYDFGHRYQYLNDQIDPPEVSIPDRCKLLSTKERHCKYESESRKEYYFKAPMTFDQRADRGMNCHRPQFQQTIEEKMFAHPPKAIDWAKSNYQRDFLIPVKQYSEPPPDNSCSKYNPPAKSSNVIFANSPGHYK